MYYVWDDNMYSINTHDEWVTWEELEAGEEPEYDVAYSIWDMVTAADDSGYLMGAYTEGWRWMNSNWLHNDKAYTIIDAF